MKGTGDNSSTASVVKNHQWAVLVRLRVSYHATLGDEKLGELSGDFFTESVGFDEPVVFEEDVPVWGLLSHGWHFIDEVGIEVYNGFTAPRFVSESEGDMEMVSF